MASPSTSSTVSKPKSPRLPPPVLSADQSPQDEHRTMPSGLRKVRRAAPPPGVTKRGPLRGGAEVHPCNRAEVTRPWKSSSRDAEPISGYDLLSGSGAEKQRKERQQLLDWAEHLYQEVAQAEAHLAEMERKLLSEKAERQLLLGDLEQMRRRSAELERLLQLGPASTVDAAVENLDLRKQLAAYAVEIDVLREEREASLHALREVQESVQQLTTEREALRLSLHSLDALRKGHDHSQQEMVRLKDSHEEEKKRLYEVAEEAHKRSVEEGRLKAAEEIEAAQRSAAEKEKRIEELLALVHELQELVKELQHHSVVQTRDYQQLSTLLRRQLQREVRTRQEAESSFLSCQQQTAEMARALAHTRELTMGQEQQWHSQCTKLEEQLSDLKEQHKAASASVRDLRAEDAKKSEELRRRRLLQSQRARNTANIVKQMAVAMDGLRIQKVDSRGRRTERLLKVDSSVRVTADRDGEYQVPELTLRWAKAPFKDFPSASSCNLQEVLFLGFGFSARSWALFPDVPPQRCFSVFTAARSFDFICPSDRECEIFMVVLTRLCTRVQGWPVPGGISSHTRFVSARGWCKVQTSVRRAKGTLVTHLLETVGRVGVTAASGSSPQLRL